MNVSFCTSCGHSLPDSGQFCGVCGKSVSAAAAGPIPAPSLPVAAAPTKAAALGHFFASHANLSLVTLLVFSGLLIATLPVGWAYVQMQWQNRSGSSATADSRSLGEAAMAIARCSPILVYFDDSATVADVASLLGSLDASIAFGPNENGAFELAMSPRSSVSPARVVEALNKVSSLVLTASLRQRCVP